MIIIDDYNRLWTVSNCLFLLGSDSEEGKDSDCERMDEEEDLTGGSHEDSDTDTQTEYVVSSIWVSCSNLFYKISVYCCKICLIDRQNNLVEHNSVLSGWALALNECIACVHEYILSDGISLSQNSPFKYRVFLRNTDIWAFTSTRTWAQWN